MQFFFINPFKLFKCNLIIIVVLCIQRCVSKKWLLKSERNVIIKMCIFIVKICDSCSLLSCTTEYFAYA